MTESPASARPLDPLDIVQDCSARARETHALAARYLDPSLVDVLRILGFDRDYTRAQGSHLFDSAGREYLDFHTGEGFASLGHNHPDVRQVLRATLDADLVDGVQIHYSALAGLLAEELTRRLPAGLDATFFASTGAEAVDSALKFARAATGRPRLVSCDNGFHGVTLGPLSLVGDEFFKEGFGPLLPGCERVPFGDLAALEAELARRDVAAFVCEPIQGRMVTLPPPGYLEGAQALCRRHGTLFILDEIQTGLGRTGKLFALEHWNLEPDFVLVGKALSGGYMPVAAMITRRAIHDKAVGTLDRCYVHQSTYGRNRLSMAAGLAALRIIERDGLAGNSARIGAFLLDGLRALQDRYEMVKEVRGSGLMIGIELGAPRSLGARASWRLFHLASEGLFPQLIVIPLHRDHGIITMAAGKNDVIKLLPPLTLSEGEARTFLGALDAVLADVHGPSSKNWGVVKDIASATLRRRALAPEPGARATRRGTPIDPAGGDACLVTGGSGFIGGHIVERLVQEGYQVRCLVRASSDTALLDSLGVELAVGDLTDAASLRSAAEGCRFVVHCGALVSDWATTSELVQINVQGTRNVLEAAVRAGVDRFVHVSTTDVYGYPGTAGVDESFGANGFTNWYAETKRSAEAEVRRFERERALPVVILRPATVYGPRSREVIASIASAIQDGNMLLIGDGRAVAGLAYVDNVVDAALLALRHEQAPGHAFNVSDGSPVTWREFTDGLARGLGSRPVRLSAPYWLASAVGFSLELAYRVLRRLTRFRSAPLLSRQAVHVLGNNQDFSTQQARALLGWAPRVDYETGLARTLDWLKARR
jgi:acetylornithine/succinyldiaminopimelate/putrescine aminotransferase/nucleoside-diphosphate-sugar epimerase